ncbi:MAG: substrate-binding domain-containing protein [Clostridiales bacterium]|nr:substrate-binding domain-containing protein [Clostridiales bacterium]
MKKLVSIILCFTLVFSLAACGSSSGTSSEDTSAGSSSDSSSDSSSGSESSGGSYKIGFTDNYNGNSYHQTMETYMQEVTDELIDEGYISELTIVEANQDANTQIQQIEDFIVQGYDLIVIDPCSTSSLNSAVEETCDAGIPCLIINDGPIDYENDLVYQLVFDFVDLAETLTRQVCEEIGGSGNIIELRGTAGTTCDTDMHQGVMNALEDYPDVTIVSEIYTDWTASTAQTELNSVLPTLDQVDGLVTQGGDAYAAVQAFLSAGYTDLPVIAGDNRGSFLKWWATEAPEGYSTISGACNPWDGAISMYIAVDILNGEDVPNTMDCPFEYVYAEGVSEYADMADDDVAITTYTWDEIKSDIEGIN